MDDDKEDKFDVLKRNAVRYANDELEVALMDGVEVIRRKKVQA